MTTLQNANPVIFNVSRVCVDTNVVDFDNEDEHEEITAEEIFEHETYALAEQFANAADGMLVKIYDEVGQILLSLVHENSSIVSDYV